MHTPISRVLGAHFPQSVSSCQHCDSVSEVGVLWMHVEAIGQSARSSDLEVGQCFFFESDGKPTFAIYTGDDHGHKAALVFSREGGDRLPWVLVGGLPQTILIVQGAQIRTDSVSLAFSSSPPPGHVIVAGGRFYIGAALRKETVTVNLETGMTEDIPHTGMFVHFGRWSVGIPDGPRWITVFDFPLTEPS
jgi:hypothetical protein